MKVHPTMIARELRLMGWFMKQYMKPTLSTFNTMNNVGSRLKGTNLKGFACQEKYIDGRETGSKIRIRTYRPRNARTDIPGILYLHGGGYALNVPETEHGSIRRLLNKHDCVIVAPDYRRSFDAPYPAALHDCYDTLQWMLDNHETLGFRDDQLFTIGGSAGGGLSIAVNLMARDIGDINIAFQAPLYPMIDHRLNTESMQDNDAPVWNEAHSRLAWDLYLAGLREDEITSYASPALNQNFEDLPPALTFVGSLDPFLDETLTFFNRLAEAGTETRLKVFEGAFHGFDIIQPRAKLSRQANAFLLDGFACAVEQYYAKQPR